MCKPNQLKLKKEFFRNQTKSDLNINTSVPPRRTLTIDGFRGLICIFKATLLELVT